MIFFFAELFDRRDRNIFKQKNRLRIFKSERRELREDWVARQKKRIADLEARMDEVRHTGVAFEQAEILRAYAVQLHLKQIARLLRATRAETSSAVGDSKENVDPV